MTNKKDIFGDDVVDIDINDYENLLQSSTDRATRKLKVGDALTGEILTIGKDETFVSTGTPRDGTLFTQEIFDENKKPKFKVGDKIDVIIVKIKGDEIRLKYASGKTSSQDIENLEDAFDMEIPVEGRVLDAVKGGFRIGIHNQRAFCPISQMELTFVQDVNQYVGKKFDFLITQMDEGQKNIIVSRRKLLELQRAETEGEFAKKVSIGDIVEGKVTRLEKYGAFVELAPSVEGLIHISEITWSRIKHPNEILQAGTPVRVKVLKIDDQGDRMTVSLSLKQGGGELDPWLQVQDKFPVGAIVQGTVDKKENFGIFVQLAPGITGLLPKSKWRDSSEASNFENKKKGDAIFVRIDQISLEDHRLTLGLPTESEDNSWRGHVSTLTGSNFGTLAAAFQVAKKKD